MIRDCTPKFDPVFFSNGKLNRRFHLFRMAPGGRAVSGATFKANTGRRYYPYLKQGLPEEDERRKQYQLSDIVELWELEMGKQHGRDEAEADQ